MIYDFGPYRVDARRMELTRNGDPVTIKRKAVQVLVALIERRGQLVTKDELVREVWGRAGTSANNVAQHIFMLRSALDDPGDDGASLLTVPRVGYRFVARVEQESAQTPGAVLAQHYCRNAKHLWEMRTYSSILSAVSLYQRALEEDPRSAEAYAGLAICRFICAEYMYEPQSEALVLAERDALRAIELDPRHAVAYVVLGAYAASLRYAWREAEQLCLTAIRLSPDLVWGHIHLIEQYICEGKLSHAWQALAHAQSLGAADEPFPRIPLLRGSLQYFSGAFEGAIADLTALVDQHPTYALARFALAKAFAANAQYDRAQAQLDEILRAGYDPLRPGQPNVRERAMALSILMLAAQGERADAKRAKREFEQFACGRPTSQMCMALAAIGADEIDAAMEHMLAAVEKRDPLTGFVVVDPLFAPLRAHEQWPTVLTRLRIVS